jgi:hypothetical protein
MLKLKLKVAKLEEVDCTLTPWRSSLIHLQRRHHTKRRESPLLVKEGTFIEGILLVIRNLLQLLGSFTCHKVGTRDRLFNFPSDGRRAEDFYTEKFQRLRPGLNPQTREPCEPLDHRSRLHDVIFHDIIPHQISHLSANGLLHTIRKLNTKIRNWTVVFALFLIEQQIILHHYRIVKVSNTRGAPSEPFRVSSTLLLKTA